MNHNKTRFRRDPLMQSSSLQSLETSAELPVDMLYGKAITEFVNLHGELAKLPADPKDPLPSADALLRDMGVERDNDMSFYVLGAMGKIGSDAVSHAFGMAANAPVQMGLDVAMGIGTNLYDQQRARPTFKRADTAKRSVFSAGPAQTAKSAPVAPQARKSNFATSILKASAARGASGSTVRHAETKRKQLKAAMAESRAQIELLHTFKMSGYKFARRVQKQDKNGQIMSFLIPAEGKPSVALSPKAGGRQQRMDLDREFRPSAPGMAPGLGLAA